MIQAWSSWKRRHGTYRFWYEQTSRCHEIQGDLFYKSEIPISIVPHVEFGRNNHREYAPYSI